jgi:putative nucleotidyltransferase with HDIG domain
MNKDPNKIFSEILEINSVKFLKRFLEKISYYIPEKIVNETLEEASNELLDKSHIEVKSKRNHNFYSYFSRKNLENRLEKLLGVKLFIKKKEKKLGTSPILLITSVTVIWIWSSVLLTIAKQDQFNNRSLVLNQPSPTNFYAKVDFEYADTQKTLKKIELEKNKVAKIFILNQNKIKKIENNFRHFFNDVKRYNESKIKEIIPSSITKYSSKPISQEFLIALYQLGRFPESKLLLSQLKHGVMSVKDKELKDFKGSTPVKVELPNGLRRREQTINDFIDPERLAKYYANMVFKNKKDNSHTLAEITQNIIGEDGTLIYDDHKTMQSEAAAIKNVKPVMIKVPKNSLLIAKDDTYTANIEQIIKAHDAKAPPKYDLSTIFYTFGKSLFILILCSFFLYYLYPKLIPNAKSLFIISTIVFSSIGINYISILGFNEYINKSNLVDPKLIIGAIPVALAPVLLTVISGYRSAICCGFLTCSITAMMIMPHESFELAIKWFAVGALTGLMVKNVKNYRTFCIKILLCTFLTTILINFDIILEFKGNSLREINSLIIISFANSLSVSIMALLGLFVLELVFNLDTDMALVAFNDYSHRVLERLKREAPGTLFHSMSVATLAEDAAKEIGANPLKAKVASLFHDIGKLSNPEYFTENNRDSSSKHLKITAQQSSRIIRNHVTEGIKLAKKERLPHWIREGIKTHHGNDLVKFFYDKAMNEKNSDDNDNPVLGMQFRYDGEPPVEKELVILSLADACEAASRSIDHPTSVKVENLVNKIFEHRLKNGQLNNANITLAELKIIKESFIKNLVSMNHGRIAYTPENINAKPSLPVEKYTPFQTIQE